MSLHDLEVGDRVQVFETDSRNTGQPKAGWDGVVTKKGTKLITVEYPGEHLGRVFRLDTGQWNNKDYGYWYQIKTVEQVADEIARDEAFERLSELLKKVGLEVRTIGYRLTTTTETLRKLAEAMEGINDDQA
jgi:hypothetical protein